ncbi:MAG: GGDEF domain-containing protein [Armatimonadota bacterium]|nr:GGDEF domain-containing protein [Armatimonadota bacterium]MDR7444661.1 GGDEF domain-containing protein [Armatimonadota bacterium]MDR7569487.1 GGDEF domain-containing protein [Armatimonadota bacterium]MDR7613630.1 GGDEF domain-containing protein [Armatimonadota bacterium]
MEALEHIKRRAYLVVYLVSLPFLVRPTIYWPLVVAFLRMEAFAVALIAWLQILSLVKGQLVAERVRANTDPLTGLLNRRGIFIAFDVEAERHRRYGHPLSVVLFDVDHFKRINDRYGHGAGDRVLVSVARTVQGAIRPSDSLARWGGEEFLLLLPETPLRGALELAERLRREIASLVTEFGPVSASFGVAAFRPTDNLGTLVRRADAALYRAKEAGRNKVVAHPVESGP